MFFLMMLGIVEKHCTYDNRTARTDQKLWNFERASKHFGKPLIRNTFGGQKKCNQLAPFATDHWAGNVDTGRMILAIIMEWPHGEFMKIWISAIL
jgi:hypothetical protein